MIIAENISLTVNGKVLLSSMDFELKANEFCVVIGPNGAGKSTLLQVLAGSIFPSTGTVFFEGENLQIWSQQELAKRRAFLQQASSLSVAFTVREVVRLGRYPHQKEAPFETEKRVDELLDRFGLRSFEDRVFNQLSGGEKQRVHFARVLLQVQSYDEQQGILFLDEPLNNLDIHYQTQLLQEARAFVDEGKGSVLAVIHDLNLSYQFADRALLLQQGALLADGSVEEVFVPDLLSQLFHTPINRYQTETGSHYFFAEKGYQKAQHTKKVQADIIEQFN